MRCRFSVWYCACYVWRAHYNEASFKRASPQTQNHNGAQKQCAMGVLLLLCHRGFRVSAAGICFGWGCYFFVIVRVVYIVVHMQKPHFHAYCMARRTIWMTIQAGIKEGERERAPQSMEWESQNMLFTLSSHAGNSCESSVANEGTPFARSHPSRSTCSTPVGGNLAWSIHIEHKKCARVGLAGASALAVVSSLLVYSLFDWSGGLIYVCMLYMFYTCCYNENEAQLVVRLIATHPPCVFG